MTSEAMNPLLGPVGDATRPTEPDAPPFVCSEVPVAQLLTEGPVTPELGARRLAFGAVGIALLQVAHTTNLPDVSVASRLWAPLGLSLSAAGALVFGLPGTLILLTVLGSVPRWQVAWSGLSRGYFIVGLLAGAFAPVVALFAWTGASEGVTTLLAFLAYGCAGTVGLSALTRELRPAEDPWNLRVWLVLAGFWCFSLVFGVYTWFRLMKGVLS